MPMNTPVKPVIISVEMFFVLAGEGVLRIDGETVQKFASDEPELVQLQAAR